MRVGFISDIHGNFEALEVALSRLSREGVDRVVCAGDLVGYGADPIKCVEAVQKTADVVVAGNHDWAAVGKTDITYFNIYGRKAIVWTSNVLPPHQRKFLADLDLSYADESWCVVHSTPHRPQDWNYILTPGDALRQFEFFEKRICFVGHSHVPAVFSEKGGAFGISIPFNEESLLLQLTPDDRYIINVGSVGQPRDGDPRGCVVIFDADELTVKFIRFFYPVDRAQEKIISAGLPSFLAERLGQGI